MKTELKKALQPYVEDIIASRDLAEQLSRALREGIKRISDNKVLTFSARSNFISELTHGVYDYLDFYMIGDEPTIRGYELLKKVGWEEAVENNMTQIYIEEDQEGNKYVRQSWEDCTYPSYEVSIDNDKAIKLFKLTQSIDFSFNDIERILSEISFKNKTKDKPKC